MEEIKKIPIKRILFSVEGKESIETNMLQKHFVINFRLMLVVFATIGLISVSIQYDLVNIIIFTIIWFILFLLAAIRYRPYKKVVRLLLMGALIKDNLNFKKYEKWNYVYLEAFIEPNLILSKKRPLKIHFRLKKLLDEIAQYFEGGK